MADFFKKLMGKKEPEPTPEPGFELPELDTETPDTESPKDFVEIGGSPVPGLTLRHVLRGHTKEINRIAWSPDGKYLASPSRDKTIRIWDVSKGECVRVLEGHPAVVICVIWSPDGKYLLSGDYLGIAIVWNLNRENIKNDPITSDFNRILSAGWSHDGKNFLLSGKSGTVKIFSFPELQEIFETNIAGEYEIPMAVWSNNPKNVIAVGLSGNIYRLATDKKNSFKKFKAHNSAGLSIAQIPSKEIFASCSRDHNICIWDSQHLRVLNTLEGHTQGVVSVSFSSDGHIMASKALDDTIRLWSVVSWSVLATFQEQCGGITAELSRIGFHPSKPYLATLGENDTIIRIWELDEAVLLGRAKENVNYTTAKLVLVGDSGVGKTGLGWRLAHNEFKEHASTHGQQFWSIPQLGLKRQDGTDCEAVLWDLAGQHVYRQVHSIFLDNVSAALVLFDPTNRQEPLKGAQFWLEQLKGKGKLPPTVLVGARVDRGAPALSQAELDQFCQRYGISGGYISTSAMQGEGLDELLEIVKKQIPWDEMTATVTTVTFKRIKDYVLSLKEKPDRKGVLVSPAELRKQLEFWARSELKEPWEFTDAEMMTAVGHLETNGIVTILKSSSGESHILLAPELLVNIAASIMLLADKNARELGAVSETELLGGKIPFDELKGLEKAEQQILTDAAILRFLEHNICFRDTFDSDTLLIFPSLIKQKRPLQDDLPATDDISYVVRGRIENLYASLVVLLGYTPTFSRINQWQNQAQYEMEPGQVCGFRSIEEHEGEIELVLYYGEKMPSIGRDRFQELFEQFLYKREVDVTRFPPAVCPKGHPIERNTFVSRMREGQKFVFCYQCDEKVPLPVMKPPQTIGIEASPWLQREEAMARLRSAYEKHLTNIKSYRRGWAMPRAFLSYLPEQKDWADKLIHDLRDAGVYILEKPDDLKTEDFIIVLDTPAYRTAYQASSPALASDAKVIRSRMQSGNKKVLSLGCEGKMEKHEFKFCAPGNFCDETHYSLSLFNLVMELYAIPLNHKGFEPLRKSMHEQWENTLAGKEVPEMKTALNVFISYSHKDEEFKDELVTMLAGLQRRGLVDAWTDRRIEAGDEWYKSIQDAMRDCDLAILLVSPDYLASRFIQDEEQPKLLKRRDEMKARVIPIIVRPCLWQSESTISILQALPKDGKPVITFPKDTGARDQAWADIAAVIEKRTKQKLTP